MIKTQLFKRVLLHAEYRSRAVLHIPGTVNFGPLSITLPRDHALPRNLKEHPLYDRFLPYLAARLPAGSTVIDVGANCGDTLAGMLAANSTLRFACIEPDDVFFDYLERNIKRIRGVLPDATIDAIKALVGKEVSKAHLQTNNGTSRSVLSEDPQAKSARSLDDIVRESSLENISLLKSDVDGFDYDVLNSAEQVIRERTPLVFFECFMENEKQRAGYKGALGMLRDAAYRDWVAFDNFGELVLRTREVAQIEQLLDYTWRQTAGRSTRTINYVDVLCGTERHAALLDEVASGYLSYGLHS
jgi:FkbM family methyltransferase